AKIANARLNTMKDFFNHPQLKERGRWEEISSPVGQIQALRPPVTAEGIDVVMGAVPDLGEHTESILEEYGFQSEQLKQWRLNGVI
ncbi:MAG TPA: CoA transferase, partial [Bacillales bacterium]